MSDLCHQCHREIMPGPNWYIVEDARRDVKHFCTAKCLYDWIKFFVPFWERIR